MTTHQVKRLIHLHEKATQHLNNYKRLSGDSSCTKKALRHLEKADRFHFQISRLIREEARLPMQGVASVSE